MKDLFDLSGRHAIITGGGGLLGYQHARALLFKNCSVEIWEKNVSNLDRVIIALKQEFPSSNVIGKIVDVTNEEEVLKNTSLSKGSLQTTNILINNAALNPKFEPGDSKPNSHVEVYSLESWEREIAVGLTGALICSKVIGSSMKKTGGVILNLSSDLSVISPDNRIYLDKSLTNEQQFVKPISYSVIKTGLIGLTRYLATYWAEYNIRVNALSPGGVYNGQNIDFVKLLEDRIPLKRMANKDEYIGAVQFLCSDASSYMTGQNLIIDGGRSIW